MNVYIFTGPTLPAEEARSELDAVYLPPASEGDVYRVASRKPQAIGIIDGYFECVPAVWHKEILWAMAQGIHVYGSASMGALRAAELAAFGMEGVGKIFDAYLRGKLEDDEEVAVAHGPAERGYRPASVAMVNIRATLEAAETARIIRAVTHSALLRVAKDILYQERSYPEMLQRAEAKGLPEEELDALRRWLPRGQVDQKRADALAMLRRMRERLEEGLPPKRVEYSFEYTDRWEVARRRAGALQIDSAGRGGTLLLDRLLDELRLEGDSYAHAQQAALLRFFALDEAWRQGMVPTGEMMREAADSYRSGHGLEEPRAFAQWLDENHLSADQFNQLMEDEARLRWVRSLAHGEAAAQVPEHLRAAGQYARLAQRARDKQRVLESRGLPNPGPQDAGVTDRELLSWYFEQRLGRPVPRDLLHYSHSAGFEDVDAFRRALLREFCYANHKP